MLATDLGQEFCNVHGRFQERICHNICHNAHTHFILLPRVLDCTHTYNICHNAHTHFILLLRVLNSTHTWTQNGLAFSSSQWCKLQHCLPFTCRCCCKITVHTEHNASHNMYINIFFERTLWMSGEEIERRLKRGKNNCCNPHGNHTGDLSLSRQLLYHLSCWAMSDSD